ncbi:MAG: lipopolysaccharide biosynthesis protein [Rhodothermales bacterium]
MEQKHTGVPHSSDFMWNQVAVVLGRWRFILSVTIVSAVLAVVISLILPVRFTASSRLILPQSPGSSLLSMLGGAQLSSTARSFLGATTGDYTRYLTILTSRTVKSAVVTHFDLIRVYDLSDADEPFERALEMLDENIEYVIDPDYEFMSINATDRDPERAAEMSNFLVDELNRVSAELSSRTAALFRERVEERFDEALADRDSLLNRVQRFQREYGVYELESQSQVFFEQMGELGVSVAEAEIQYDVLRERLGAENNQTVQAGALVRATQRKYREALSGQEAIMPVATDSLPTMIKAYAELQMQRVILESVIEALAPIVEQARFEEARKAEALQVVDRAVPPVFKSEPKRALICIISTFSIFVLCVLLALVENWFRVASPRVKSRLSRLRA